MKRALLLLLMLAAFGCKKPADPASDGTSPAPSPQATNNKPGGNSMTSSVGTPGQSSGGGGIAPMTSGAAGGLTPVSGTESVEGSGMGGLGSAAKDQARKAAAGAGAPNLGQETDGG